MILPKRADQPPINYFVFTTAMVSCGLVLLAAVGATWYFTRRKLKKQYDRQRAKAGAEAEPEMDDIYDAYYGEE
ncbi:hypothetical protein PMZ80_004866 [Knufia obscura]|uniref:Uncharacterized protein n=1 Tax=Knufia obscura TaxID=1635080 RepID=A0ABR0RPX3_9EURO|nr:hypothetical protein PMZ80_004866 [Knufia obscura]